MHCADHGAAACSWIEPISREVFVVFLRVIGGILLLAGIAALGFDLWQYVQSAGQGTGLPSGRRWRALVPPQPRHAEPDPGGDATLCPAGALGLRAAHRPALAGMLSCSGFQGWFFWRWDRSGGADVRWFAVQQLAHGAAKQRYVLVARQPVVAVLHQRDPHVLARQTLRDALAGPPGHVGVAHSVQQAHGAGRDGWFRRSSRCLRPSSIRWRV